MKRIPGFRRLYAALACRRMRGLVAASIYNDLPANELHKLESHLAACDACRAESESMRSLAALIPIETPELDHDLWPALRRELRRSSSPGRTGLRLGWNLAAAAAVCTLLLSGGIFTAFRTHILGNEPVVAGNSIPLENDLTAVAAMIAEHDYVGAYKRLAKAVEANGDSPLAGEARVQLADLAYSRLNWYPEAFAAYDSLFREHPDLFSARSECISRRELLDEARVLDYAPLYALDAARRGGESAFARLEALVARYPDSLVAAVAVEEMARESIGAALAGDAGRHVEAMERARSRCTNPVAIARLKLELGHIYAREVNDASKARSFYADVATFENKALAQLAEGSLAALEASPSRGVADLPASAE